MKTGTWLTIIGVALCTLSVHTGAALGAPPAYPGANGQPFQALQTQINDINTSVAALQTQINDINAQIASLEADVAALQAQVAQNTGDIAALQTQVANNSMAIAILQATAAGLQNQINLLNATKQNAITGACPLGSSIRQVLPSGGVVCEFDDGEARTVVFGVVFPVAPFSLASSAAVCPSGWLATGGGHATPATSNVILVQSEPSGLTGWFVTVLNNNVFTIFARATVMCALSQ